MVLNVIQPWGGGYFERLMPRYREVAMEFTRFLQMVPEGPCFPHRHSLLRNRGIGDSQHVWGYVERYVQHDALETDLCLNTNSVRR